MTDEERQQATQFCDNARYFLALRSERALQSALYFYDQALALDPRSALAYAGKAKCYAEIGDGGYMIAPLPQLRALDFANKALALDAIPEAIAVRAKICVELRYAWDEADRELARSPEHPEVTATRSLLATYRGSFDEALACTNATLPRAVALLYARRADEARSLLEQFDGRGTQLWSVPAMLGLSYYLDGDIDRATHAWERARAHDPTSSGYLLHAYGRFGRREEYHALSNELHDDGMSSRSPFVESFALVGIGDHDGAIAKLERGLAMRDPWMPRLLIEPALEPLHEHPGFENLAQTLRNGTELPLRPGT